MGSSLTLQYTLTPSGEEEGNILDEQLLGSGFRVQTNRCKHRTRLSIHSYASAYVTGSSNGLPRFTCDDISPLYVAEIPSAGSVARAFSVFGFGEAPEPQNGPDPHAEEILFFGDELSLEMWLSSEFLPALDFFEVEDDEMSDEDRAEVVGELTKQIMADTLANRAGQEVRRTWQV